MAKPKVLIYGGGRLGQQVARVARAHFAGEFELAGVVDDSLGESDSSPVAPWRGGLDRTKTHPEWGPGSVEMLFAIGYSDLRARHQALRRALEAGYTLRTMVHPQAMVDPSVTLGAGSIVMAGAILDQKVSLGAANYIDIGVSIGEECSLGEGNYLANRATLAGCIGLGDSNFVGLNATLVDGIQVGDYNFINAASLVHQNVGSGLRVIEVREQRMMAH